MKQKVLALAFTLLCCAFAAVASAAGTGSVTGDVHTKGSERAMQVHRNDALKMSAVSWDVAAPKHSKPSLLADVWLIGTGVDFRRIPEKDLSAWYREKQIPKGVSIYYTQPNSDGLYRFAAVPAGIYYLMVLDPYGEPFDEGSLERDARLELLAKLPHPDEAQLYLIGVKSCLVQKISVKPGENTHVRLAALKF